MNVGKRQRRHEVRDDERRQRRHLECAHRAIDRERERDRELPPWPIHQRVVPSTERDRRPHLEQRQRRWELRSCVEIRAGRLQRAIGAARERGDAAELEPYARFRRPLGPGIPREKRLPRHLEPEKHESQRDPQEQRSPCPPRGTGELGRREQAGQPATRMAGGKSFASRRHPGTQRPPASRATERADRESAEFDPDLRQRAHPQRQHERADEIAGAGNPGELARLRQRAASRARPSA